VDAQNETAVYSSSVSKFFDEFGVELTVTKLPPMKAQLLWLRLMRIFGPALGRFFDGLGQGALTQLAEKNPEAASGGLGPMLESVAVKLTETEFEQVRHTLLQCVTVQGDAGKSGPFLRVADALCMGRTVAMWKVLGFAVEANYADFFDVVRAAVARFRASSGDRSKASPTTSSQPGPAGG